jgi:hypothetical protein
MESDLSYFRRRSDEELAAANTAGSTDVRAVHFEMAERYAKLAAAIEEATDKLGPLSQAMSR